MFLARFDLHIALLFHTISVAFVEKSLYFKTSFVCRMSFYFDSFHQQAPYCFTFHTILQSNDHKLLSQLVFFFAISLAYRNNDDPKL